MSALTTKKAIGFALKELLLEKPLNKITINDIASRCDINRQTFYYHFQDIVDLVEWICLEDAEKALKNNSYANWAEGFLAVFEIMKKDRPFIMNIYDSVSKDVLTKYLYRLVFPIIYSVVEEKSKSHIVREDDRKFIADFYMYAFVAIVLNWIGNDMREDPKTIVYRVSVLVSGTIEQAVGNLEVGNVDSANNQNKK